MINYRERYRRKKAAGICVRCSEPAEPNRAKCARHLALDRQLQRARVDAGLCISCDAPAAETNHCTKHTLEMRARQNRTYRERRDEGLCKACDAPANGVYCEEHAEQHRVIERARYHRLKAVGA